MMADVDGLGVAFLVTILIVGGLAVAVNIDRGGQLRLREFNRTRSVAEERSFELGTHHIALTWLDGWTRGEVGRLSVAVPLLQRGPHRWTLLWQLRTIAFEMGGTNGAIRRSSRTLTIEHGGRAWRADVRARGGLTLTSDSGIPLVTVGPWAITPLVSLSEEDAAIAIVLVVCGLDVYRGPLWVRTGCAVGLRRGWPQPFPRRGWNRRIW